MNAVEIDILKHKELTWREWLEVHGAKLLLFARQQTRSDQDSEDILQEALLKLSKKISTNVFNGGQEAWLPYLYTQLRREAIDLGRKKDRRGRREQIVVDDKQALQAGSTDPWFESQGAQTEKAEILQKSLEELPDKFSEVVIMKIWG